MLIPRQPEALTQDQLATDLCRALVSVIRAPARTATAPAPKVIAEGGKIWATSEATMSHRGTTGHGSPALGRRAASPDHPRARGLDPPAGLRHTLRQERTLPSLPADPAPGDSPVPARSYSLLRPFRPRAGPR